MTNSKALQNFSRGKGKGYFTGQTKNKVSKIWTTLY